MKVYISGKITGLPESEVVNKFGVAEMLLTHKGYKPVNPLKISPVSVSKTWKQYMLEDIEALFDCDAIYMLHDWGTSPGARIEYQIARERNLIVMFEGEFTLPNIKK